MRFIDEVAIEVTAGRGGHGCMAFRREKFRPRGGPCGGDGGRGGDIVIVGDQGLSTLIELKYSSKWRARSGENGKGKDMYGKGAPSTRIRVPVGTVVTDEGTGEVLADITRHGQEVVAAAGGRGGRGNLSFKSATRTAPDWAEQGKPGEHRRLRLELQLIADVGLAGFPNVGKSSLIRKVSASRPRVADYPFTTLVPNLGVVRLDEIRSFVIADIPGIIEGASQGAGLGLRFLRHIERTRLVCHILDAAPYGGLDPLKGWEVLNEELRQYSPRLAKKPQVVVLNKIDLPQVREKAASLARRFKRRGIKLHAVSALTGEGVPDLMEILWRSLGSDPKR
jgi:GTP-binding protein